MLRQASSSSRGRLFPGVGATGGGSSSNKHSRLKRRAVIKRIRFAIVVLLIACYFLNTFISNRNFQNEHEKSMKKVNSHYAKVDRHSRRERKQMQREDHLSKIFGLIEEDDNNNYNVRGGDERKTLSQLAGGQFVTDEIDNVDWIRHGLHARDV